MGQHCEHNFDSELFEYYSNNKFQGSGSERTMSHSKFNRCDYYSVPDLCWWNCEQQCNCVQRFEQRNVAGGELHRFSYPVGIFYRQWIFMDDHSEPNRHTELLQSYRKNTLPGAGAKRKLHS